MRLKATKLNKKIATSMDLFAWTLMRAQDITTWRDPYTGMSWERMMSE